MYGIYNGDVGTLTDSGVFGLKGDYDGYEDEFI